MGYIFEVDGKLYMIHKIDRGLICFHDLPSIQEEYACRLRSSGKCSKMADSRASLCQGHRIHKKLRICDQRTLRTLPGSGPDSRRRRFRRSLRLASEDRR